MAYRDGLTIMRPHPYSPCKQPLKSACDILGRGPVLLSPTSRVRIRPLTQIFVTCVSFFKFGLVLNDTDNEDTTNPLAP